MKILIVDDEENARFAMSKLLANEGHQVAAAANGLEALAFLDQNKVDIIITDINMPEMDGLIFLREVNRAYPRVKVIMVTAYGAIESYLEAMNLGACEYLNKPVPVADLRALIQRISNAETRTNTTLGGPSATS
jgi:DNA-binding NtrC family response regulator